MATLLRIDASLFPDEASASRSVTSAFTDAWRAAHPDGTVVHRDLAADPLPHLDVLTVSAGFADPSAHSEAQAAAHAARLALIEEAEAADAIVIGAPMYNFGLASGLKAWLDHVILNGRTSGEGARSLAGKPVVVVASRGGSYEPGTPREGMEYVKNYLGSVLSEHLGITPEFITIQLTLASAVPAMADLIPLAEQSRAEALEQADAKARELAAQLSGEPVAA
ncbi:NAD(P)H dehydrogenase (quinone) [Catenulispora acidiphila DSM 44928]|uniref:FMN dependent NADH:quinone oxidoreductase n=1 Tax=Catenulispora acidiphila (strain DSM 44928 / JCM 14897 / NBRC 102108 / NRRL B-24433 / ID139908) TaxID=479433 RepID=C7Q1R9_CATAD|nr:NAD(P)H-dependent oxidoreductase [Catenulispora acidiphila]ACU75620.1 NAD(P)H dehydrogenase (quinone) [Catenulispora acidiphila DSM 44928]